MNIQRFYDAEDPRWDKVGQACAIGLAFTLPISTAVTSISLLMILCTWILGPNKPLKRALCLRHPLVVWIYPLLLLSIVGIAYSIADNKVIYKNISDSFRLALIPVLIYFYRHPKVALWALWAFTLAMVVTLFFGFLKVYAHFPIGLKYTAGAVFKSHIKTSFFMAIAAYFLAFQLPKMKKHWMPFAILVIGLMIYYLFFMSFGRIGYITFLFCALMLAWQWGRFKGLGLALLFAVGFIALSYQASPVFHDRINMLAQDLDFYREGGRLLESSLGSRIAFAKSSLSIFTQDPVWGKGLGSFADAYAQQHLGENTLLTDNPHNEYLRIVVELGMLGLFALMVLFYKQWQLSCRLPLSIRGFCQGVLLTFMVGCFFNSWLHDSAEGYFYCVMSSILFASLPLPSRERVVSWAH